MKKNKILSLLLAIIILSVFNLNALAFDSASLVDSKHVAAHASEGNAMVFESVDDDGIEPVIRPMAIGGVLYSYTWYAGDNAKIDEKAIDIGSESISKEFVKYLTSSWATASSYTWSNSVSVSWTYSTSISYDILDSVRATLGLSRSRTTSYSVSITLPATSTLYSKLGFASDYTKQNVRYEKYLNNVRTENTTGYIKTPTVNTYLTVYYQ